MIVFIVGLLVITVIFLSLLVGAHARPTTQSGVQNRSALPQDGRDGNIIDPCTLKDVIC